MDLQKVAPDPERPVLPIFLHPPGAISVSGLRVVLDERGWPRAAIAEGPAIDDRERLALYIAAEFEEPLDLPRSQLGTEWLHLSKARHDLLRAGDASLSGDARFGGDPPDFEIHDGPTASVELAQFTQSPRREVLSLLRFVKQAVIRAPRTQFAHLRNRLVFIGFEDPRGLPPRSSDQERIEAILNTLQRTPPGPEPKTLRESVDPHGFGVQIINSPLGSGASACFPLPALPQSDLSAACGFEIAASLTLTIRARDTEAELARITTDHDSHCNDILLISAGAPGGSDGFPLIGDEIAVESWIAKTLFLPRPGHLKRILLHRWSYGDVYELFPNYTTLSASEIPSGGPHVVPVGRVPDWAWDAECPCASGGRFRECHGILGGAHPSPPM